MSRLYTTEKKFTNIDEEVKQSKSYKYNPISTDVFTNIVVPMVGPSCEIISDNGKRCVETFQFTNIKNKTTDCSKYCINHILNWLDSVFENKYTIELKTQNDLTNVNGIEMEYDKNRNISDITLMLKNIDKKINLKKYIKSNTNDNDGIFIKTPNYYLKILNNLISISKINNIYKFYEYKIDDEIKWNKDSDDILKKIIIPENIISIYLYMTNVLKNYRNVHDNLILDYLKITIKYTNTNKISKNWNFYGNDISKILWNNIEEDNI